MLYEGHGYNMQLGSVEYILRVVRYLGLDQFWILGHSMGAGLGSLYTATFPEHVQVREAFLGIFCCLEYFISPNSTHFTLMKRFLYC